MYFEYIHIHRCNRFSISGHKTITIRPTSKTQMVLGTNGSGKSSLLSIGFSPLPPDPKDFEKGGSWEVRIAHKGRRYILSAHYGDKNIYDFIIEGNPESLNPGHTLTVQLELVKEHFNYTRDLHDLLIGNTLFTTMTPQARRDWIARLSQSDFEYAFAQYKRFQKGLSKTKDIGDFLQRRINEEKQRLLDPDDVSKMRVKVKELHQQLVELMRIPPSGTNAYDQYELAEQFEASIRSIECFLMQEYPIVPGSEEDDFDTRISKLGEEKAMLRGRLNAKGEVVAISEQKLRRIEALMKHDPKELESTKAELENALEKIPGLSIGIHEGLLSKCGHVISKLRLAVANIPGAYVSNTQLMELNNKLMIKRNALAKANNLLDSIVQQIGHIERCTEVICPACNTTFKPGVEPGALNELREREDKGHDFVKSISLELSDIQSDYDVLNNIHKAYQELERIRREHLHEAQGLFTFIDQCGGLEMGRGLAEKIAIYERELGYHESRKALTGRLESVRAALEQYRQESGDYSSIKADYDHAISEYEKTHHMLEEIHLQEQKLIKWRNYSIEYDLNYKKTTQHYEETLKHIADYIDVQGDAFITETIQSIQKTIGINENALAENDLVETLIKDFEIQLEKTKHEEEAYKRLVQALSPKGGVIAEQIYHQIGALLGGINQMIKRVWGYPLYLKMPEIDGMELDYKFPFIAEGSVPRDDVSKGSASIKEIVNRAFALVAYYSLDMVDYPLFLDEPGHTFDEIHNQNLIPLIKDLADSGRFSQILIISHDIDSQTAFPNSETIILDDRNIRYPHPYNDHVEFA